MVREARGGQIFVCRQILIRNGLESKWGSNPTGSGDRGRERSWDSLMSDGGGNGGGMDGCNRWRLFGHNRGRDGGGVRSNGNFTVGSLTTEGGCQGSLGGGVGLLGAQSTVVVQEASANDGEANCPDADASSEAVPLQVDKADVRVCVGDIILGAEVDGGLGSGFLAFCSGNLADLILGPVRAAG